LPSQRGGGSAGVECKGRGEEDREGDEDRPGRLDVLNRKWRRNVGKTPSPQTALRWALVALGANRAAKRQGKRQAQPSSKREAKQRKRFWFHATTEQGAANVVPLGVTA